MCTDESGHDKCLSHLFGAMGERNCIKSGRTLDGGWSGISGMGNVITEGGVDVRASANKAIIIHIQRQGTVDITALTSNE